MITTINSLTLHDVCTNLVKVSDEAAATVREEVERNSPVPLEVAELFEQLANDLLDITALVCASHRQSGARGATENTHDKASDIGNT